MNYRPRLNDYHPDFAQAFCQREMAGRDFAYNYVRIEASLPQVTEKIKDSRKRLSVNNTYAAGMLTREGASRIDSHVRTVWLSDDTLVKQINNRKNDVIELDSYALLPEIINDFDEVEPSKKLHNHFELYKKIAGKGYLVVIKVLSDEIFIQSFRRGKR